MKSVEISAKKVEDAISLGLVELRATLDEVSVEVLDSGGLFKKAKVRITLDSEEEQRREEKRTLLEARIKKEEEREAASKPAAPQKNEKPPQEKTASPQPPKAGASERSEAPRSAEKPQKDRRSGPPQKQNGSRENAAPAPQRTVTERPVQPDREPRPSKPVDPELAAQACAFVAEAIRLMGIRGEVSSDLTDGLKIDIAAPEGDDNVIIGYRGETLSALQYLTQLAVRVSEDKFVRLTLNCNGFRERRESTLKNLARRTADKCVKTGRKVKLEPMDRMDRRIIHTALSEDERIVTKSEGNEPYRRIVVLPKRSGVQ